MRDKVVIKDQYNHYHLFYEDDIKYITNRPYEPWYENYTKNSGKIIKWIPRDNTKFCTNLHNLSVVLKDDNVYHFELSEEDAAKFIEEYSNIKQSTPSTTEHIDGDIPNPEYKDNLFICTLYDQQITIDGERVIKYYPADPRIPGLKDSLRYLGCDNNPVIIAFDFVRIEKKEKK